MTSADDVYPELPPIAPWPIRVLLACLCPLWFALDWFYSRNWWALLAGLPVLLAGGAVVAILLLAGLTSDEHWGKAYQQRAMSALRAKDPAAADVYFRRLTRRHGAAPAAIYGLAETAAQQEDHVRARALMRRIAPEDASGYAPAHFWLAKDLLKNGGRLTPEATNLLVHHLTQSLAGNAEAHALLGQIYAARRDAERAIPHLVQGIQQRPDLQLLLAGLYLRQKDTAAARIAAQRARDFFQEQAKAYPQAVNVRLQWAQSAVLLKDYEEAVRILREALTASDAKSIHAALVDVYLRWYASIPEREAGGLVKRLELLNAALAFGPGNPRLLSRLADLATRDWDQAGEASAALHQALARGTAPVTVHTILGTMALLHGDAENGRMHLELAYQGNPQSPAILNNLAWALANREPPELDRALELAQAAKELSNHPEICDTIGTILARQGRYRAAVAELEAALKAFPDRPGLHSKLAELYKTLGDSALAELHQKLAKPHKKPS